MFCPVIGRGAFSADDSQEAVLDFFTLLIHYQGVPVAVFVGGFAQLAGQRQLRFALFAEERAFLVESLDERAVKPETDERRLERVGERSGLAVVYVAEQRAVARAGEKVHLAVLELELDHGERAGAVRVLADGGHRRLDLEKERFGRCVWLLKLLLEVQRHHVDAHIRGRAKRVQPVAVQRAHQLVLAGVSVVKQVIEILGHAPLLLLVRMVRF